jgi:hypothetical protein
MKLSPAMRYELIKALLPVLHRINRDKAAALAGDDSTAQQFRWDVLHESGYPLAKLRDAGLSMPDVDAELRTILG